MRVRRHPGRRFWFAFLAAVLGIAGLIAVLYEQDAKLQGALLERDAAHVVAMQREHVLSECRTVESDLRYLTDRDALAAFMAGAETARSALERDYARFAEHRRIYDQIRCLDNDGREAIRINFRDGAARVVPAAELQSKGARYYVARARGLRDGEVFVSPIDLNVEHGEIERPIRPVLRFVTPIFGADGQRRGLVVLNYLGATLLSRLRGMAAGFAGDALLVDAEGEYLSAPPGRAWGWLLGHDSSFRRDHPDAWVDLRGIDTGLIDDGADVMSVARVVLGSDRRKPVAADLEPATTVFVVARMPAAVARAQARELLWRLLVVGGVAIALVGVSLWFWARASLVRAEQERQLASSEARLRELSNLLLAAQESERRQISRELHDELGQQVTAIVLDLRSAARSATGSPVAGRLDALAEEADGLLRCLHEIATRVRPAVLDDLGLREAVQSSIADFRSRHDGVDVDATLELDEARIPPTIGAHAYRIVQEAISNAIKHAEAPSVSVSLATVGEALELTVTDTGRGFDPDRAVRSGRLGLLGMRERAELLGGRFSIQSALATGTTIHVVIPLTAAPARPDSS